MLYQGISDDTSGLCFIPFFELPNTKVRLITELSITFVTSFIS